MKRSLGVRVYNLLVRLVPDNGTTRREMREVFRDAHRDAARRGKPAGLQLWLVALFDVARTAAALRRPSPREFLDATVNDVRVGMRSIRKTPGYSAVVVLTLAMAIGVNSTIFSLGRLILFPPLPIENTATFVFVRGSNPELNRVQAPISLADFKTFRERATTLDELAAYTGTSFTLTGVDRPARLVGTSATANVFHVFGIEPVRGRGFLPGEDEAGANAVALVSHGAWQRHFGADPNIVGTTAILDDTAHTVVGVLPEEFEIGGFAAIDVWTPMHPGGELPPRDQRDLTVIGRLAAGVPVAAAHDEIHSLAAVLQQEFPDSNAGWEARVLSFREAMVGPNATAVFTLLTGAVMFILVIACANVANLLLSRAAARRQELAVRQAMGARRGRLVRQLLTESAVLAILGSVVGLVFARWTLDGLVILAGGGADLFREARIDTTVLGFALLLALLTPLIFGVVPALRSTRVNLAAATREAVRGSSTGRRGRGLPSSGSVLAALQVSMAVVLLVVASLASRSVLALLDIELGFNSADLVTLQVDRIPAGDAGAIDPFFDSALRSIESTTAISTAAWTSHLPLVGNEPNRSIAIEGKPPATERDVPWVATVLVSPKFFETLDIPQTRGRPFTAADNADARHTALISEAAVERYWGGDEPLGSRIKVGGIDADTPWLEIVGVVGDIRNPDADQPPEPHLYLPLAQHPASDLALVARTTTDAERAFDEIRGAIWNVDADQPIDRIRTMGQVLYDDFSGDITTIGLIVFLALVALSLASAGVYAVIAFSVSRRDREIGIRMALGARSSGVLGMVLRQGITPVLCGLGLGLAAGFAVSQMMAGMLYGVGPRDPVTFFGVPALLTAVGAIASLLPAIRATHIDPLEAIRAE